MSKVTVSARYIPVQMKLDPVESINNMGTLRVDVLDAADLPSADRNGYSDPYCKFHMGDEKKEIFKTKVQKKTLHPAWNEFFETPIKSRIGAKFRVDVYDWDFGDKADHLGATPIDLEALEPFQPQEVTLPLDGKSGVIRLKLLFKPTYVVRSRQGSATFSGTFAVPGKIVGAPVKGVGMGVGFVGGNVVRGASFLKHGFKRKDKNSRDDTASVANSTLEEDTVDNRSERGVSPAIVVDSTSQPSTPQKEREHSRKPSTASTFGDRLSVLGGVPRGDTGTAHITIVSASGFPPSANLRVLVRVQGSKGAKEIHKTKAQKTSDGLVTYDDAFKVSHTTADAQFQIRVVDHSTFGSDEILGEALFFVDDQASSAGQDKSVPVGEGSVTVRSNFVPAEGGAALRPSTSHSHSNTDAASEHTESPDSRKIQRRSFLSKRSVSGA